MSIYALIWVDLDVWKGLHIIFNYTCQTDLEDIVYHFGQITAGWMGNCLDRGTESGRNAKYWKRMLCRPRGSYQSQTPSVNLNLLELSGMCCQLLQFFSRCLPVSNCYLDTVFSCDRWIASTLQPELHRIWYIQEFTISGGGLTLTKLRITNHQSAGVCVGKVQTA